MDEARSDYLPNHGHCVWCDKSQRSLDVPATVRRIPLQPLLNCALYSNYRLVCVVRIRLWFHLRAESKQRVDECGDRRSSLSSFYTHQCGICRLGSCHRHPCPCNTNSHSLGAAEDAIAEALYLRYILAWTILSTTYTDHTVKECQELMASF